MRTCSPSKSAHLELPPGTPGNLLRPRTYIMQRSRNQLRCGLCKFSSVETVVDDFLAFHVHYTVFLRVGRFELAGSVCLEVYPCSQRSIGTEGYLFGLYLFSHQPYATGTLLLRKQIYPRKSSPNLRSFIFFRVTLTCLPSIITQCITQISKVNPYNVIQQLL